MELTPEQEQHFQKVAAKTIERQRRISTRFGFKFGGAWGMIAPMILGIAVPLFGLAVVTATPFWQTASIRTEHQIISFALTLSIIILAVVPFVYLKPKYALLAEIGTTLYVIAVGILSGGLNSLLMVIVNWMWDAGIRF